MTITQLFDRICQATGWNVGRLNKEAGVSARTSQTRRTGTSAKESFDLKILRTACYKGETAAALAVLLGENMVPTALRAAAMFPDLLPAELELLRQGEHATHGKGPLSEERIRCIIDYVRLHTPKSHQKGPL